MKYLKFVSTLLFAVFRKAMPIWVALVTYCFVGLSWMNLLGFIWLLIAYETRSYSRNTVYNYILAHPESQWLKRLYERNPTFNNELDGYTLSGGRTRDGFIKYKQVYWFEFYPTLWLLWGFVDDDSNHDVTDKGFIETITSGEREHWLGKYFIPQLEKEVEYINTKEFGNTFELGDYRNEDRVSIWKCPLSTFIWGVLRNGAYNFKYYQYETIFEEDLFDTVTIFGYSFGYKATEVVAGEKNYTLVAFEKEK